MKHGKHKDIAPELLDYQLDTPIFFGQGYDYSFFNMKYTLHILRKLSQKYLYFDIMSSNMYSDKKTLEFVSGSDEEHWKARGLRSVSVAGCSDVTDKGVQVC